MKYLEHSKTHYLISVDEDTYENEFNKQDKIITNDVIKNILIKYNFLCSITADSETELAAKYKEIVDQESCSLYFEDSEGNLLLLVDPNGTRHVNVRTAHKFPNEKTVALRKRENKPVIVRKAKDKPKKENLDKTDSKTFLSEESLKEWRCRYFDLINLNYEVEDAIFISFVLTYNKFISDNEISEDCYSYWYKDQTVYKHPVKIMNDAQYDYYIKPILSGAAKNFDVNGFFYCSLDYESLLKNYYDYKFYFYHGI
jgi:hypothetical protein